MREITNNSGELLRYLQSRRADMIATVRRLVEVESPSFNKARVDHLGRLLAGELFRRGARIRFHKTRRFGDHLQADFPGGSGPPVLLLGHMDTVWELGTLKTMPFREKAGRLWGPGVLDMKAGIAQMLFAIEALRHARGRLPRPVTVLLVTDEEVGSETSRAITERLAKKSAAVLVCEPAAGLHGALKTARKGVGEYKVRVFGRAAHSGLDSDKGQSAVVELAQQICKITSFMDRERGMTVNPGVVRGGTRSNVVAAQAEVEVDARVARLADGPRLDRKFRSLRPFNPKCKLEITGGINRPPLERTPAVVALFKKAQALARELGFELDEAAVGGGSDGNFTAALGVPTLDGMGAVGEGAHAANESVVVAQLAPRTALLAGMIESV